MKDIEITEIKDISEKKKWFRRFLGSYKGDTVKECDAHYDPIRVRFFLAKKDNKELGFIRINDKSDWFENDISYPVWCATDAYVKPAYRGQNVQRALLEEVALKHDVRMIYLQYSRFDQNRIYFASLGFTVTALAPDGEMVWVFRKDAAHEIKKHKKRAALV